VKRTFKNVSTALANKGFMQANSAKHPKYVFTYKGKATGIFVLVRHGRDELSKGWIRGLCRAMKMPSTDFLEEYIDCTKNKGDYESHLRSIGYISN
jgi:hypothetical protein